MSLFLFNPEQCLIGKLSKNQFKPFHGNDKKIIEKNLKNLLGVKLVFSDYIDDNGKVIADTIGIDRQGVPYLIGYKKSGKDNFFKRYENQYEKLMTDKYTLKERLENFSRVDEAKLYSMKCVIISSQFTAEEIEAAKSFVIPCELYTWTLVDRILIFEKVIFEK